ncbi:hypothetical protein R5R35_011506 [Gryllus longicercus]|uniref:Peroxisomal membrane protein 2 n=1 Tax=Gryllus longicercus TaxID=2509291 RepID=A0AAN9YZE3_9ORTH
MALSKPIYSILGLYFEQLHSHSLRTRSISSSLVAVLGNVTSQYLSGVQRIDYDSVLSFGVYGLLFGSTLPNVFYRVIVRFIPDITIRKNIFKQLLVERLLYTPLFIAVCLYVISRLQGLTSDQAVRRLMRHYLTALKTNWLWFTILQYAVLRYGPPILQVPLANIVEYVWYTYLAHKLNARTKK